jgi:manganese transport protein
LLAAGQSSTFTGTIAGQIVMEGFMQWKIPCWQRRLLTRVLALVPAYLGVALLGDGSVNKLLVLSQVVLCLQLPFTIYPLIVFASDQKLMGAEQLARPTRAIAWILLAVILAANSMLLSQFFSGT